MTKVKKKQNLQFRDIKVAVNYGNYELRETQGNLRLLREVFSHSEKFF